MAAITLDRTRLGRDEFWKRAKAAMAAGDHVTVLTDASSKLGLPVDLAAAIARHRSRGGPVMGLTGVEILALVAIVAVTFLSAYAISRNYEVTIEVDAGTRKVRVKLRPTR